ELRALGLRVLGDLAIGMAPADVWAYQSLLLRHYVMGAPPSRTNPDGQPWHYPVLDPAQFGELSRPGPALRLLLRRVEDTFEHFAGVRTDHPHGLVCPWVYRPDPENQHHAVQTGARLFSSPDLPDHPELARHTIVRREQLDPDPRTPRYADDWVVNMD